MTNTYTTTAKALHWLIAVLIFCMIPLGFVMTEMDFSPEKLQYYSWHKWAGVSVFLLSLIRLVWRVLNPPPELPEQMNQLLKFLAHIGHYALYLLCFIIPVSGWLMSSAKGVQTVWFGVLPIPDLLAKDKALGAQLAELHEILNWILVAILTVHVIAALKHQFIDKDNLLSRILPKLSFFK